MWKRSVCSSSPTGCIGHLPHTETCIKEEVAEGDVNVSFEDKRFNTLIQTGRWTLLDIQNNWKQEIADSFKKAFADRK